MEKHELTKLLVGFSLSILLWNDELFFSFLFFITFIKLEEAGAMSVYLQQDQKDVGN